MPASALAVFNRLFRRVDVPTWDEFQQLQARVADLQKRLDALPDKGDCTVELPAGTRWHKADRGEAVSWMIDERLNADDAEWIEDCWSEFRTIVEANCSLRFVETRSRPDIFIGMKNIDGSGSILAQAEYRVSPSDPTSMIVCRVYFDPPDSQTSARVGTHLHEGCHAIGIGHRPGRVGLMAANRNSVDTFGPWEHAELRKRYPIAPA